MKLEKHKMDKKKQENPWLNIIFNIAVPTFILIKLSKEEYLGPLYGLIIALAFPLGYGIYDLIKTKQVNFVSVIGLVSVLLTGIFGILKLPPEWIAWKEAGVPLLIGIAIPLSMKTRFPLFEKMLYNDTILKIDLIEEKLSENRAEPALKAVIKKSTYLFSLSFLVSSILNFALAKYILVSPPGTEAYTEELGKMNGLSFPVIALPSMLVMLAVFFYFIKSLEKITSLKFEEMINAK